jgi:glycerol-3-phosphate dehydrogenase
MSSSLNLSNRDKAMASLEEGPFDLLVIGGGITGAGIARDAAIRGLKVALVEARDFASGTSSRSTKLVHGGLRYLAQGDVGLVREAASERAALRRIAPHLAQMKLMLIPSKTRLGLFKLRTALSTFERLGKVPREERFEILNASRLQSAEPSLRVKGLAGAARYPEFVTDDARLVIANIRSAVEAGAVCVNYTSAVRFLTKAERVSGVEVVETLGGRRRAHIKAGLVVNAAGPWVDAVRAIEGSGEAKLQLTKGIHLVFAAARVPCRHTILMIAADKRGVFAVPRGEFTYVGTTDTFYPQADYWPEIDPGDVGYLLETVNRAFDIAPIADEEIVAAWAGLRPLVAAKGKSPSEISRKEEILESRSGLISIAGGKLTAYRKMAERVVDLALIRLTRRRLMARTAEAPLPGGDLSDSPDALVVNLVARGIDHPAAERLVRLYGSEAEAIVAAGGDIAAEARFAVEHEGAAMLEDYWARRSARAWFSEDAGIGALAPAARAMAPLLGWSAAEEARQIELCRARHAEETATLYTGRVRRRA